MMLALLIIFGCIISRTIQFCPQPCECNDNLLSVSCSVQRRRQQHHHQSLDQIPIFLNPQVKSLDLHGNDIFDIGPSLQFYGQLIHLDISGNKLTSLGGSNFENLKNLQYLNMSNNQFTMLTNWGFKGLSSLLIMDLSSNQIEIVEEYSFSNLSKLEWINLSHNRLTEFTVSGTLEKVTRLDLEYNRLQSHFSFDSFTNVKRINLAFNKMTQLDDNLFDYNNIQWLNLSNNALVEIPSLLTKLSELNVVDISSNQISFVQSSSFQNLFKLTFIDLSHNPISSIHPLSLLDNINLITFKLDYSNNLQYFDMNLLNSKPYLKLVSLKYCQLTHIQNMDVDMLLKYVDVTGNPWNCNCSTVDILNYMQEEHDHHGKSKNITTKTNVICSKPLKFQGVSVYNLDLSQFEDCYISESNFFTNTVFLGTGLFLFLIIVVLGIKVYRVYKSKPSDHRQTMDIMVGRTFDSSHLQYDPHGSHVFDKQVPSILV